MAEPMPPTTLNWATIHRKLAIISCIIVFMAGCLFAYDRHSVRINHDLQHFLSVISLPKELKYLQLAREYAKSAPGPAAPAVGTWDGVPVFVYHGIVKKSDIFSMTEDVFKDQMFAMKRAGYRTVTLQEFREFMKGGRKLPAKSFLLTFDDGRLDSYEKADPILKVLGYHAVMFVAVESSMPGNGAWQTYYISAAEIKDMVASKRWEIGSHALQETGGYVPLDKDRTKGNFLSNRAWLPSKNRLEDPSEYQDRLTRELAGSKASLEKSFKRDITALSYPFGDYGQQTHNDDDATSTIRALIAKNYQLAFRQVWPKDGEFTFNYPGEDPYRLKRVETPTDWSGAKLVAFLETSRDKQVPYAEAFTGDTGWHGTWGEIVTDGNSLVASASLNSAGAAAYLDGTETWRDYAYTASFERRKGSHVSLMARYKDARNYLTCTYGEGHVKIERVLDSVTSKLADVKSDIVLPEGPYAIGMRVHEGTAECLLDQTVAVSAAVPVESGGIGIRIWDKDVHTAAISLTGVSVEAAI